MSGIDDIATERKRQIEQEGWTPDHDAAYHKGEMVKAAVAYASHATVGIELKGHKPETYQSVPPPKYWPWSRQWWKPKDPRRDLVKAGALIAAEIDRLDREAAAAKAA